jgi:hypothetical protein
MSDHSRRAFVKGVGAAGVLGALGGVGIAGGRRPYDQGLELLGHSLLSDPVGAYADADISPDGQYAALAGYQGTGGSFLADISDPTAPSQVHRVPGTNEDELNADVKFDPRGGLYYRTQEGGPSGVEVIDFGFDAGTPSDPEVVADLDIGDTHNVSVHGEEPYLYAANESGLGVDVIDVSDPASPVRVAAVGPNGDVHDIDYDAERELLHVAYISGTFRGYAVLDASEPTRLPVVGAFDYRGAQDYDDVSQGNYQLDEGFENCYYATADPDRGLAYVGDEKGTNVPGGKHVFDIGYDVGSLSEPVPIGFVNSPNAELQEGPDELFDWTTHNHSVVPRSDGTFLVGGDYHDGAVLYDVTEPRNPVAIDQYLTDDGYPNEGQPLFPVGDPPMAWTAEYHAGRDLVVVSDMFTGIYTFRVRGGSGDNGRGRGRGPQGRDAGPSSGR